MGPPEKSSVRSPLRGVRLSPNAVESVPSALADGIKIQESLKLFNPFTHPNVLTFLPCRTSSARLRATILRAHRQRVHRWLDEKRPLHPRAPKSDDKSFHNSRRSSSHNSLSLYKE